MRVDLLIAEIGSTTTVVNAFDIKSEKPKFLGGGYSKTTVLEGDVNIGLKAAVNNLCQKLKVKEIIYDEFMASSSAAGGLKMTVHGLVHDMTVRAAKESALGAGANIKLITSGKLRQSDLEKIKEIRPNIILIAGGVDYGERNTAIYNSQIIAELDLDIPIIYAGNIENDQEIKDIFFSRNREVYIVPNVYPKIDTLNISPTKKIIQEVFEKHIVNAKGMDKIRDIVKGPILPTPGAVMEASILLYEDMGDLLTIDVGGATTDIHSISKDTDEIEKILIRPEPLEKRTVEGDLGVYINSKNLLKILEDENMIDSVLGNLGIKKESLIKFMDTIKPIPETEEEIKIIKMLSIISAKTALYRHVGQVKEIYGPTGKKTIAEGKDLTAIKFLIGTGGALTRLAEMDKELEKIIKDKQPLYLLPNDIRVLIDKDYIMASIGVMAKVYPKAALRIMQDSLKQ